MEALFIPIGIIVVALVIAGIYFSHLAAKKRREELNALAQQLDWTFDPLRHRSINGPAADLAIFTKGHSRRSYNTLSGALEIHNTSCRAQAGDYTYRETHGSGKNRRTTTYHFSYLILDHPYPNLPALIIRPEGIFDKMAGVFGFDDIDFESAEFSKRFYVKSSDKKFAYGVIDPRMMEFLLHTTPPMLEISRGILCLSDGKRTWTPAQYKNQISWLIQFFEHWPRHVVDELQQN